MIPLLINQSNIFPDFSLRMSKRLAGSDLAVIGLTGIGPIQKISKYPFCFKLVSDCSLTLVHQMKMCIALSSRGQDTFYDVIMMSVLF